MSKDIAIDDPSNQDHRPHSSSAVATRPRGRLPLRKVAFWTGLAVVPAAIGMGVAVLARSRRAGVIAGGITALGMATVRWQVQRLFNDEPDFVVENTVGKLEIRRYVPRIEARTKIDEPSFDMALERGFDRLAKYIFGANRARARLPMTGPVTIKGEKLAMTSPVLTRAHGSGHVMAFVMPAERTIASLPRPEDDRIELIEVPARRVAVLGYHGRYSAKVVADKELELIRLVSAAGLFATGEPMVAGFDPPWTLPFLRRTEIWIELV